LIVRTTIVAMIVGLTPTGLLPAAEPDSLRAADCSGIGFVVEPQSMAPGGASSPSAPPAGSMGPLRVNRANPRYFSDPRGRAVLLAGSHTWNNIVDMGGSYPPPRFNFRAYLDYLQAHGHNAVRLWAWEIPWWDESEGDPRVRSAAPLPWVRTGPGADFGGLPRFDLTKLNRQYFQRLRERVMAARQRGIYCIIMLFEAHVVQIAATRNSHPFFRTNNINGTDYLQNVEEVYTLRYPPITAIQRRYLQAVVDSVSDLDNVLFEIANEGGGYSNAWQHDMLRYLRCYEATKPEPHPIGLSFQIGGHNHTLFDSDADWISPGIDPGHYATSPAQASGAKVVIADTDHLGGASFSDVRWPWHTLLRGLNLLYMDNYVGPESVGLPATREAVEIRAAIGIAGVTAEHLDIGRFQPASEIASTGYAMRAENELLVYTSDSKPFSVDLSFTKNQVQTEWLDVASGQVVKGDEVRGGRIVLFNSPAVGGSMLYIRPIALRTRSLAGISNRAEAIQRAAKNYAPWTLRMKLALVPWLRATTRDFHTLAGALAAMFVLGVAFGGTSIWLLSRARAHRT
jgi:hypothetical protein